MTNIFTAPMANNTKQYPASGVPKTTSHQTNHILLSNTQNPGLQSSTDDGPLLTRTLAHQANEKVDTCSPVFCFKLNDF